MFCIQPLNILLKFFSFFKAGFGISFTAVIRPEGFERSEKVPGG